MSVAAAVIRTCRRCASFPRSVANALHGRRLRRFCRAHADAMLQSPCRISNPSGNPDAIVVGSGALILGDLLVFDRGGRIEIGRDCFVSEGTRIWSRASIRIGDRVLVAHDVEIHDTPGHSLSALDRHNEYASRVLRRPAEWTGAEGEPISIEDDAWIGFGATIMKGVTVGRGAVVGARTIITKDVPAYAVVVGNPARIIGTAEP